ncbi:MAG: hypothetical protein ACYTGL_13885 [Planctomycetota bacterium]|jgi:hypothetical protein
MAKVKVELRHRSCVKGAEGQPGDVVEVDEKQAEVWFASKGARRLGKDGQPITPPPAQGDDDDDEDNEPPINEDDADGDILNPDGDAGDGIEDNDAGKQAPKSGGRSRRKSTTKK